MKYALPKGTFDLLPNDTEAWKSSHRWQYIERIMREISHQYGFEEIRTPIFERTELFTRSVGETSDIIAKEMYTFKDKADRSMSLRPEGTAPAMRAYVENHLHHSSPRTKLYYIGPYFRYDRPQAGRFRQFHQFGVEYIGEKSPECDFEIIDLTYQLLHRLGLKNLTVMVNSVGSPETRGPYIDALKAYLEPHYDALTSDSKHRLEKNPLRILDTKIPQEIELLEGIPHMLDFLDEQSRAHFDTVCALLERHSIPFEINHRLVRGLDYYTKTVFEVTSDALGAQNSIAAGGRFDGLVETLGGPSTPACGVAMGIERILQTMLSQQCHFDNPPHPTIYFIPLGEQAREKCLELAFSLRHEHVAAEIATHTKLNKGLKQASDGNATFAAILGDEELEKGTIQVKHLETREAKNVPFDDLVSLAREYE